MPHPCPPSAQDRFAFERRLLAAGHRVVAGTDEAGRGPLAGPVVAAAVVFPAAAIEAGLADDLRELNDSKQLTPAARERFYELLLARNDIGRGVAVVDAATIDALNILQATHRAMNEALRQLQPAPDHVLVDGLRVRTLVFEQTAVVGGDALSYSIAAASVLAKVTRDRLMDQYAQTYPGYGFERHRGYGTPAHLAAIARLGPCPIHRRSFAPFKSAQLELWHTP